MLRKINRVKPIETLVNDSTLGEHTLHKTLTSRNLIALGIGAIIGTGIFVLLGKVAAENSGPAVILSILISGIGCVFAGLCYAEFASMIPVAGSAYTYSYATLGEFMAWILGWNLVLEYLFASATVAVGWSKYFVSLLNDLQMHLPNYLTYAPMDKGPDGLYLTGQLFNVPAMLVLLLITILLIIGIKESVKFNNIIVVLKVSVLLLFIGIGMFFVNPENWKPFIPENTGDFSSFGITGLLAGAGIIFFAYIGFDAVSTAAQESKNPQRDMPIGILGSLLICTILYVAVAAVLTGMAPYTMFYHDPAPIASAIDSASESIGSPWYFVMLKILIKIGAIAGMSSVMLVMLMAQSRIFYSMSKDGLLPPYFSKVHSKYKSPHISTIISGIVAIVIAGIMPIGILGELVSIGTLMAFSIVCISILILRKTHPDFNRPFKTPWVPVIPLLGAFICIVQMIFLPVDTWVRLLAWMFIGVTIYFTYGYKHSKLNKLASL